MLADKVAKYSDQNSALESHMRQTVQTKSIGVAKRLSSCRISIDGSNEMKMLINYSFIMNKASPPDIISMDEIAAIENADNPKDAIKKLVQEAKERRKAM